MRNPSETYPAKEGPNPAAAVAKSNLLTCSTCGMHFRLSDTPTPPFCSERCQLIDLGRWLDEEIGLPFEGDPGDTPVEYID